MAALANPADPAIPAQIAALTGAATTSSLTPNQLAALANQNANPIAPTIAFAPALLAALTASHPAVRHAACHLVRVLARGVAPLRTTLVDSGLGVAVFRIFMRRIRGVEGLPSNSTSTSTAATAGSSSTTLASTSSSAPNPQEGEWEERAVVGAALGAVCNAVNEFSPLRPVYIEGGLIPRLGQLLALRPVSSSARVESGVGDEGMEGVGTGTGIGMGTGMEQAEGEGEREGEGVDNELRLGVLWALKNLLNKSPLQLKREVMTVLGWGLLGECVHLITFCIS